MNRIRILIAFVFWKISDKIAEVATRQENYWHKTLDCLSKTQRLLTQDSLSLEQKYCIKQDHFKDFVSKGHSIILLRRDDYYSLSYLAFRAKLLDPLCTGIHHLRFKTQDTFFYPLDSKALDSKALDSKALDSKALVYVGFNDLLYASRSQTF